MDSGMIKLELIGYLLATNLVAFGVGILLAMIQFNISGFFARLEPALLVAIVLGGIFFLVWTYHLFTHLWRRLA